MDGLYHVERKTDNRIYVYVGVIPKTVQIGSVTCEKRNEDIAVCVSDKARKERYCVWKLLEYALRKTYGNGVDLTAFEKQASGKWVSPNACFSLSHSGEIAVVALAECAVGIDVERGKEKLLRLHEKILCDNEKVAYATIQEELRVRYLMEKWTQKEAVFKAYGKGAFLPKEVDTNGYSTLSKWEKFGEEDYCISLAVAGIENVSWEYVEEYL